MPGSWAQYVDPGARVPGQGDVAVRQGEDVVEQPVRGKRGADLSGPLRVPV